MRPAEAHQIVDQRLRQVTHFFIGHNGCGPVTFAQARLVRSQNHRDMSEFWHIETQRLIHQNLAWCIVDMVVTANDMSDVHERVVDDDGKIISRISVTAFDDQIVQLIIIETYIAFNEIFNNRYAGLCTSKADNT